MTGQRDMSVRTGRLTVLLGAAPGVGKTHAMLTRAHELLHRNADVVVAAVNTHGSKALEELLAALPHHEREGWDTAELDLDGILARRPEIALVDDLAHRNPIGSRHEHRWQDIEELLDAGIDVLTTVNVHHLESLNDVVEQITGIRISDTVPDALFDRLHDIRLVDLPARELIERLSQGKVSLPEPNASQVRAFFKPSHLMALRELAMQTVAEHVDADLRERRSEAKASSAIQRHVMVAIDGRGQSDYLVRAGCRIAERRGVPWSVVTVKSAAESTYKGTRRRFQWHRRARQARQLEIDRAFALARSLGGNTTVLHGADIAATLLNAADARNARTIVIGRTRRRHLAKLLTRSLTQQLLLHGARYELTIASLPRGREEPRPLPPSMPPRWTLREPALLIGGTLAAVVAALAGEHLLNLADISMIFILAVLLVASRTRMAVALMMALVCFLAYNFLSIEPRATFYIGSPRGITTVAMFLATALIAGRLASRLRSQVVALHAANAHAVAMQLLGRQLAQAADLGQVISASAQVLQGTLKVEVWMSIGDERYPPGPDDPLSARGREAAEWTRQHGQPSGRFTDTLAQSRWWCLPVASDRTVLGVIALKFPDKVRSLTFEQRRLAEGMVMDIGQAALRTRLVEDLEAARVSSETERLRAALLSSVSHDLRSPLSSMIGASDSLLHYGHAMNDDDRTSLLETIKIEGERLDRYIQNLLDMTRLGQPGLTLTWDWIGIDELIGSAVRRLNRYVPHARVAIQMPERLPPVQVHLALLEQAIFNVMENAAKFSPNAPIDVQVSRTEQDWLRIDVSDAGPGIPAHERHRVFDMFYSVERGDRGHHGTGLGLTIVQGIIKAHDGQVEALPGPQGTGTTIRMELPWRASTRQEETHVEEHS